MDLNYLYHRHQISHYMAENAACQCSRLAHLALANGYAAQIDAVKLTGTGILTIRGASA